MHHFPPWDVLGTLHRIGCLVAAIASAVFSGILWRCWPSLPFMDRVGLVFLACLGLAIVLSLLQPRRAAALKVDIKNIDYSTSASFNLASLAVIGVLTALYAVWW